MFTNFACQWIKYFTILVASWGLRSGSKAAFRPAMELASGELSGIGGKLLFMTATATSKTIRVLMDQLPERKNWEVILNNPMRDNVTIVVPTPDMISSKYEEALAPFIGRINKKRENYLILVRGKVQTTCPF